MNIEKIKAAARAAKANSRDLTTFPSDVLELIERLEAAERDAARYRWLRNQADYVNDAEIDVCKMYSRDYYAPINCMLDDAIDAAMLQGESNAIK